jgi:hypothetical protein
MSHYLPFEERICRERKDPAGWAAFALSVDVSGAITKAIITSLRSQDIELA